MSDTTGATPPHTETMAPSTAPRHPDSTPLLPCPHCGAQPDAVHAVTFDPSPNVSGVRILCDVTRGGCGAAGPQRMLKSTAVNAWNRRTPHRLGCACAACRAEIM